MRASVSSFSEDFDIYRSQGTYTGWQANASRRRHARAVLVVAQLQPARQRRASRQLREQARLHGRAGHGGHGRHGRAGRPQPAQPRLADPRLHDGHAHDPGPREAEARLRDLAAPARELHARLVGQRLRSARPRRTCAMRPATPSTRGAINVDGRRYTVTPADFAPTAGDLRHLMHGAVASRPRATAPGTTSSPRASTTTTATSCARRRSHCRRPPAAARGASRTRTARAGATLALRATRRPDSARGHILDLGVQLDDYRLRTLVSNADDWLAGAADDEILGVSRRHRAREPLRAGHLGVRATPWRATLGVRVERWERRERRRRATPRRRSSSASVPRPTCRRSSRSRAS